MSLGPPASPEPQPVPVQLVQPVQLVPVQLMPVQPVQLMPVQLMPV